MGMQQNFLDILSVIRNDETMLRLLYYKPEDAVKKVPDPLSPTLPDILKMESKKKNDIRNDCIFKIPKSDDLINKKICRVYVYPGRRTSTNGNFLYANQQVVFDILVHESFEDGDLRSTRIVERLNELFALTYVTGIGKMQYLDGDSINAPKNYIGFRHVFKIVDFKKDSVI